MYPYVGLRVAPARHPNVARWMKRLARRASFAQTKSSQDKGLDRLSKTPVLAWLRRTLGRPESERSRSEKLRLVLLRQLFRRVLGAGQERPGAGAARAGRSAARATARSLRPMQRGGRCRSPTQRSSPRR